MTYLEFVGRLIGHLVADVAAADVTAAMSRRWLDQS